MSRSAISARILLLLLSGTYVANPAGAADPPFYQDKQDLLHYLTPSGDRRAVRSRRDWTKRRQHILANMQLVMGPLPRVRHNLPLEVKVIEERKEEKYTWRRITYLAEPGDRVPAWLYIPHGLKPNHRAAGMVSLHGTSYQTYAPNADRAPGAKGDLSDRQYARELAEHGYVVVAPDYVLLTQEYKTDPYALGYSSGTMKAVVNHIRAVDLLAAMPEVDPKRIGAIGLSLGGHNALFLAALDTRVRAAVTSAGFNAFPKYYGGDLTGWTQTRYMPRVASVYGKDPKRMPFDFPEVLAAIAPRAVFVNAPLHDTNFEVSGVRDCVDSARPVFALLGAAGRLEAQYPEGGHGFARDARQAAYAFLRWELKAGK
ncbi:MAG: alpha/beta hydrolase family protein [Bryobacteraceae bacterium]